MPDNRQYIACQFANSGRTYTYHNDGEPLAVGDQVKVETRNGRQVVDVVELVAEPPRFETKPILNKIEPEPADETTSTEGNE
jgi:hypothetical protein